MPPFEYRHVVGFEETNLIGNVYYANYVLWQGRCRELFLKRHAPDVLRQLTEDLYLVTTDVSCHFLSELFAFDEVAVRMWLKDMQQNKVSMLFEYWKVTEQGEELVARGEQRIACLRKQGKELVPTPLPSSLSLAVEAYVTSF